MTGPGVYVLIGPSEGGIKTDRIYVGEAEVLKSRLDQHQKGKDFWTRAVVFTAKDANLNKAHVKYLEARLIDIATDANRSELDNGAAPTLPSLSESDLASMESFLDDMLLIYPVLGLNAFERHDEAVAASAERLFLKGKATAEGRETSDGFVVLRGALARTETMPTIHAYAMEIRNSFVNGGLFIKDGEHYRLTEDYEFGSPSTAAMVLLGRTANGRIEWKTTDGVTLKTLQEQAIDRA
jgi:hypothetical protein